MGKDYSAEYSYKRNKREIPADIIYITSVRTFAVLITLTSAIVLTMSIIYRPWRVEYTSKKVQLEISIWDVCRVKKATGEKCYPGEYSDIPAWFSVARWLLVISMMIQYLCAIFMIIMLLVKKNNEMRHFWLPSFVSLFSAGILLIAMVVLILYWQFEFLEDSRKFRMGWRSDQDTNEKVGWVRNVAWAGFALILASCITCLYAHVADERFRKDYEVHNMRRLINSKL